MYDMVIPTGISVRPCTIVDSLGRIIFTIIHCTYDVMIILVLYCCMFIGNQICRLHIILVNVS